MKNFSYFNTTPYEAIIVSAQPPSPDSVRNVPSSKPSPMSLPKAPSNPSQMTPMSLKRSQSDELELSMDQLTEYYAQSGKVPYFMTLTLTSKLDAQPILVNELTIDNYLSCKGDEIIDDMLSHEQLVASYTPSVGIIIDGGKLPQFDKPININYDYFEVKENDQVLYLAQSDNLQPVFVNAFAQHVTTTTENNQIIKQLIDEKLKECDSIYCLLNLNNVALRKMIIKQYQMSHAQFRDENNHFIYKVENKKAKKKFNHEQSFFKTSKNNRSNVNWRKKSAQKEKTSSKYWR
ncbi:MAG: hypothetical protein ACON5A_06165 [Candidatus Comchoanobacterales bacterium]